MKMEESIPGEISSTDISNKYYKELYIIRLGWTRHVIPVSFKDETGFIIEGYLDKISNISDEDYENTLVDVSLACLPLNTNQIVSVLVRDIYPSRRQLIKKDTVGSDSPYQVVPLTEFNSELFDILDSSNIQALYRGYPGVNWTLEELRSALNNPSISLDEVDYLEIKEKRTCLITHQLRDAYSMKQKKQNTVYTSIQDINKAYTGCTECNLGVSRESRSCSIVPGRGNVKSQIMVIGEAPGVLEEENLVPFFEDAPAGSILHKVLKAADLGLDDIWLTNAVLCRPEPTVTGTQNGTPTQSSIQSCRTRLKNELFLVNPKIVVLLGRTAYISFIGEEPKSGILSNIGWLDIQSRFKIYLMPHPSFIARQIANSDKDKISEIKLTYLEHWKKIKNELTS